MTRRSILCGTERRSRGLRAPERECQPRRAERDGHPKVGKCVVDAEQVVGVRDHEVAGLPPEIPLAQPFEREPWPRPGSARSGLPRRRGRPGSSPSALQRVVAVVQGEAHVYKVEGSGANCSSRCSTSPRSSEPAASGRSPPASRGSGRRGHRPRRSRCGRRSASCHGSSGSGGAVENLKGGARRTVGERGDEVRLHWRTWLEAFVEAGRIVEPVVGEVGAPPVQLFVDSC